MLAPLLAASCLAALVAPARAWAATYPNGTLQPFLEGGLVDSSNGKGMDTAPFTIFFVSDTEPRMRGNSETEVLTYVQNLAAYKTSRVEYFEYGDGKTYRLDPKLVILGGDISVDRGTSTENDAAVWAPLAENGIALMAGFGNHDWESTEDYSYSYSGDLSNRETVDFCRQTYNTSLKISDRKFSYKEFGPSDSRGPVTFLADFGGIQIVNFNTFLFEQSYHYDLESTQGQACAIANASEGYAGCQIFTSAEPQIAALEQSLSADPKTPTLFVQHYPFGTSTYWWDDSGASGTTLEQRQNRLASLIGRYDHSMLFSGHHHKYQELTHDFADKTGSFTEYVAPYFGGDGGVDLNQGGGFLALLVSPVDGILEVKHIPTPLYDASYVPPSTTTPSPTTILSSTTNTAAVDLSVLGSATLASLQTCIPSKCIAEAIACAGDTTCKVVTADLLKLKAGDDKGAAAIIMSSKPLIASNAKVAGLAACLDANCGTAIVTVATTSSAAPTTSPTATSSSASSTSGFLSSSTTTTTANNNNNTKTTTAKGVSGARANYRSPYILLVLLPFAGVRDVS